MNRARAAHRPIVIERTTGWSSLALGELWSYRDLFWILAWRDVRVRYKQTVLGVAWTILQPVVAMIVFSVVFGGFAKVSSDGVPYPIFAYAALLPWALFSGALQRATNSLIANGQLLTKVYFPRLLIPIGSAVPNVVDFGISLAVLVVLMAWFRVTPGSPVLLLPLFALLAVIAALSLGLWMAALNVRYRDIGLGIPFLIQIGLFVSPIIYPASLVPGGAWSLLYGLNPMTLIIQGFRWGLIGSPAPEPEMFMSLPIVAVLLVSGVFYFRRLERSFADVI